MSLFTEPVFAEAVCSNSPTVTQWIACEEAVASTSDIDESRAAIVPKLLVDITLEGRRIADMFPDNGYIINDGGNTDIFVNGVLLHSGTEGATGNVAANGLWDIIISRQGRNVDVTDDPWTFSEWSFSTVTDRDFGRQDFGEASSRPVVENEMPERWSQRL